MVFLVRFERMMLLDQSSEMSREGIVVREDSIKVNYGPLLEVDVIASEIVDAH